MTHSNNTEGTSHDRIRGKFLMESELAERWKKTRRTIQRLRRDGTGPAFHRIGGSILYKVDDVEAYEASVRVRGLQQ